MCKVFIKFDTHNESNTLIVRILIKIDDLNTKLKFAKFGPKTEMCSHFYEIWYLEQIKRPIMNIVLGISYPYPKL